MLYQWIQRTHPMISQRSGKIWLKFTLQSKGYIHNNNVAGFMSALVWYKVEFEQICTNDQRLHQLSLN